MLAWHYLYSVIFDKDPFSTNYTGNMHLTMMTILIIASLCLFSFIYLPIKVLRYTIDIIRLCEMHGKQEYGDFDINLSGTDIPTSEEQLFAIKLFPTNQDGDYENNDQRILHSKFSKILLNILSILLSILEIVSGFLICFFLGLIIASFMMFTSFQLWLGVPLLCLFWIICLVHSFRTNTAYIVNIHDRVENDSKLYELNDKLDDDNNVYYESLDHAPRSNKKSSKYRLNFSRNIFDRIITQSKTGQVSSWNDLLMQHVKYPLRVLAGSCNRWYLLVIGGFFIIGVSILLSLMTCKLCVAYNPADVSSLGTRYFSKGPCEWNEICYTYFTVPEDMSTSMIVNFNVFSSEIDESIVYVRRNDSIPISSMDNLPNDVSKFNANCFHLSEIYDESRYQCWADLTDLVPGSVYFVVASFTSSAQVKYSRNLKFRTGPSNTTNEDVVFITGGDMQIANSKSGVALLEAAKKQNPLFIAIGGDIAYENGIPYCYRRVDNYMKFWDQNMITDDGKFSIPILTAIGNHESGGFKQPRNHDAFYLRYFPHEIGLPNKDHQLRNTYHYHRFGSHIGVIVLDSYIHEKIEDQVPFIRDVLSVKMKKLQNRYAMYHAALWPSRTAEIKDIVKDMVEHWGPLFDAHNLTVAFENHFHNYKQTYPLKGGKIAQRGTIFVGDGSLGVEKAKYFDEHPNFKKIRIVSFFLTVRASPSGTHVMVYVYDELEDSVKHEQESDFFTNYGP